MSKGGTKKRIRQQVAVVEVGIAIKKGMRVSAGLSAFFESKRTKYLGSDWINRENQIMGFYFTLCGKALGRDEVNLIKKRLVKHLSHTPVSESQNEPMSFSSPAWNQPILPRGWRESP